MRTAEDVEAATISAQFLLSVMHTQRQRCLVPSSIDNSIGGVSPGSHVARLDSRNMTG